MGSIYEWALFTNGHDVMAGRRSSVIINHAAHLPVDSIVSVIVLFFCYN
jgi:hypothetical protein